jgi:hypothetical protein
MTTVFKEELEVNAKIPVLLSERGSTILVSAVESNADCPIVSKPSESVTLAKSAHFLNTSFSIVVTLEGIASSFSIPRVRDGMSGAATRFLICKNKQE